MPKTYTEVEIFADEALNERLIAILSQVGFEGFWEDGNCVRCYMSRDRWTPTMAEEVQQLASMVQRSGNSVAPRISIKNVPDRNWNDEWEKTIRPIHVTGRIVITPTWHAYAAQPGEIVLTIDPKMSFGTGYHETTRLVLKLMEKHVRHGWTLLDVGTGTGVLAIAGIQLGASFATGVDNDTWSFENALENIKLNHVENRVRILFGELSSVQLSSFDMIVANIQRNVIEPLLPAMVARLNRGGVIILSGLLSADEKPLRTAVQCSGMEVMEMLTENEWIAFALNCTPS